LTANYRDGTMAERTKMWTQESRSRALAIARTGRDFRWHVAERHHIRGDVIHATWGAQAAHSPYQPLAHPELAEHLAEYGRWLADGTSPKEVARAAKEWASDYGFLHVGNVADLTESTPSESVREFHRAALRAKDVFAAAAKSDWASVHHLLESELNRVTLSFQHAARYTLPDNPVDGVDTFIPVRSGTPGAVGVIRHRSGARETSWIEDIPYRGESHATFQISEADVERLGVFPRIEDERMQLTYRVPDLSAAISLHLADLATGSKTLMCKECRKEFIVTHGRMKYCSTRCQERAKKRRQRANK
jgi:hypothetical protein